jgi:flagellar motor switch protein FliN
MEEQQAKKAPYYWLRKIDEELVSLDDIPLIKEPVAFNWQELSHHLSSIFSNNVITVTPSDQMIWREGDEVIESMGDNCLFLSFNVSPIIGDIFFVMSESDIAKLTKKLMLEQCDEEDVSSSSMIEEGFYRYLCLEAIYAIESMGTFDGLSLKMTDQPTSKESQALCIDITINIDNNTCFGRLCITPTFRQSWDSYFATTPSIASKGLEQKLELLLKINAGYTSITQSQFDNIKTGDFILLDRSTLKKKGDRGIVTICLGSTELFKAKLKSNKIKILDYAFYGEVAMEEEEKIIPEEKIQEEEAITEEELPAEESEMEEVQEDVTPAEEIEEEEEEEEASEDEIIAPIEEFSAAINTTPINITVEVARFNVTMEKLTQMRPGNFLELPVSPDQGVTLSVNGKKIGRAELVHLGEALGIRILELGK